MMCPKCKSEDLLQKDPGFDTLQDDGVDVSPEDTFVAIEYECPKCGVITMFFDYDRTEQAGDTIHQSPRGKQ